MTTTPPPGAVRELPARHRPTQPAKARPGDRVAVLSPSFAAPAVAPAVHEQALRRLRDLTGLEPVEYPTTRRLDATPADRAADLNAAWRDPSVRAVLATIGGDDQITVVPHLDADAARADPKPFVGYSDNTNILSWLWTQGVAGFYGGSTQVHLGPGPEVDPCHLASLRAALLDGGSLEITEPGASEDFGLDWHDPAALTTHGEREPVGPWLWAGPARRVSGPTWGGCLEVVQWVLTAGRLPADPAVLDGAVLLVETSEDLPPAHEVAWVLRSLGERGLLQAVAAVVAARPPASAIDRTPRPDAAARAAHRRDQADAVVTTVARYNPDAVVCVGPPFGHTRPQWIVPYGGTLTVDGATRTVRAHYDA